MDKSKKELLDKILKDEAISNYISKINEKQAKEFYNNIERIYDMLHLKNKVDADILNEISDFIDIQDSKETEIVRELKEFNQFKKKLKKK